MVARLAQHGLLPEIMVTIASIEDQACSSVGCSPPPRRPCRARSSAVLLRDPSLPAAPAPSPNNLSL